MAISGDYPTPVTVNGFSCKNCTEVDEAKKHIDPAHPKDGPFGIDADPTKKAAAARKSGHAPAVTFGGVLASPNGGWQAAAPTPSPPQPFATGAVLNIQA